MPDRFYKQACKALYHMSWRTLLYPFEKNGKKMLTFVKRSAIIKHASQKRGKTKTKST